MEKRLNVLFISSWFPTKNNPTNGNFVESHAKASSFYHNIRFIHVSKTKDINEKFRVERRMSGTVDIQNLYFKSFKTNIEVLGKLINNLRYFKYYNKLFRELPEKPDIVHANVAFPIGLMAVFFKFKYGVNFVLTEHWSIYQKVNRWQIGFFKKYLFKWIARKASVIMPVSQQLEEVMKETGLKGDYHPVPNTINSNLFRYIPQEKQKTFQWIHISTLTEEVKNPKGMLRAYKCLLEENDNTHFTIISDGKIEPIQTYANEIGISDNQIQFISTQTEEQIASYLSKSHAFVLFSNYENLPLVIIESFACGLPVISTDVGGIKERFPNEFGILIEKGDEDALLKAMQTVMANYETYNPMFISEYAQKTFSYEAVGSMFSDVYKKLLSSN